MALLNIDEIAAINMVKAGPTDAPPIVFLHPVGLDLTWWGPQIDAFGRDHQVIAFDMPGHGLSGDVDQPLTFDLMVKVLEHVLLAAKTGPAHVVGVSVGGMIAQHFALRRPDLVRSLMLAGTLCTFPENVRPALRERARVARDEGMAVIARLSNERWFLPVFRERRPDVLERTTRSLRAQDADFHARMWEMIERLNLEAQLPQLACPTLVITGAEDGNAPPAAAQKIAGLIPGAALMILPGLGHFIPFEDANLFNELLRQFLSTQVDVANGPRVLTAQ